MPVQKFRTIDDMNAAPKPPADSSFERFLRHCARYWKLAPKAYPRGVVKFRSMAEADAHRHQNSRMA